MCRWLCVALLCSVVAGAGWAQQKANPDAAASAIPEQEAHFTPEQLQDYYLVYTNPAVRYLRTVFDAYLQGKPGHTAEFELLKKWDREYYRSKFMVCSRDPNPFGGQFVTIMFQDKPDKIFVAWVYPATGERKFELRALELGNYSDQDVKRARIGYRALLEDKDHTM